jgi:hypothetical protein
MYDKNLRNSKTKIAIIWSIFDVQKCLAYQFNRLIQPDTHRSIVFKNKNKSVRRREIVYVKK